MRYLLTVLGLAMVMLAVAPPAPVAAQTCDGYCGICYPGHFWDGREDTHYGQQYHTCGNGTYCTGHPECEAFVADGNYFGFLRDQNAIDNVASLSGAEIAGIVERQGHVFTYNDDRGAVQRLSCDMNGEVTANYTLTPQQLAEFRQVLLLPDTED